MKLLLGLGIPVLYLIVGSVVTVLIWDVGVEEQCRNAPRGEHRSHFTYSTSHDGCYAGAIAGGFFWPIAGVFILVWAVMKGRKQPKKTRLGRAQRKARKVQAYIDQLERDLGIGADK